MATAKAKPASDEVAAVDPNTQVDEIPAVNPDADVHHMIRSVGAANTPDGIISPDVADEHIRTWVRAGYKIQHIETLESGTVNGVYRATLLYVLIK